MSKKHRSKILGNMGTENYTMSDCPFSLPKENLKFFHSMQDNAGEEPYHNYKQYGNAYIHERIYSAIEKGIKNALNEAFTRSEKIAGLSDYTISEVEDQIEDYVQAVIYECDMDAEIYQVHLHGSRLFGVNRKDSDLDAVIFYSGDEREDDFFNALVDEPYYIDDIKVDFNPI